MSRKGGSLSTQSPLKQDCATELSLMMEIFSICAVQWEHVTIEHSICGYCNEEMNFSFYLILINLNSHMRLIVIVESKTVSNFRWGYYIEQWQWWCSLATRTSRTCSSRTWTTRTFKYWGHISVFRNWIELVFPIKWNLIIIFSSFQSESPEKFLRYGPGSRG